MSATNPVTPSRGNMSKSAFVTFLYKGALSALTFVNSVFAARFLGKVDRVEFQNAGTIATMGQRFVGGFASYYSYSIPRDPDEAAAIANMGNLAVFTLSLIIWAGTFILTFAPIPHVHLPLAWTWALLAIPLNSIFSYGTRLLQGTNSISWLNRANTMQPIVFFIILLPLWLAGRGLPEHVRLLAIYASWLTSFIITAGATMIVAYRFVALMIDRRAAAKESTEAQGKHSHGSWWTVASWRFAREHWLGTLKYGGWFTTANMVNYVNYRIDFWLVLAFVPLRIASDYGIARTASEVLLNISSSVAQVVYTRMISSARTDAIRLTQTSTRQTFVSCGIVSIVMYAVFPWLILFAYGSTYRGAILPFCILLPGIIFRAAGNVLMEYATNTLGSPRTTVWMSLVSIAINGALCLALLPTLQMLGGAIASSAAYFLSYFVILYWFQRQAHRPAHEMWPVHKADYAPYGMLVKTIVRRALRRSA
ncbi:oligosaccharide flippase family protein [Alicyclobacillus sp. ALC3]|uniref:oligosaccharide flippase family protein n=1 Tax=Alicyclobacillus sp. ALC3 TaxID=2796143 RepID=UPI002377D7FF|nr:polysaccharide biosynthesis C-terminal domain-containing protein [Alicyclobacillus sp. ALC3]WDL98523.1 polysaccharide biosynthesis C-terminal domain-containing protein [Alicyclobacillus sp. ALC3]